MIGEQIKIVHLRRSLRIVQVVERATCLLFMASPKGVPLLLLGIIYLHVFLYLTIE